MKDYKSLYVKWLAFFQLPEKERIDIVNQLHDEVKKGFDVITRLAIEELESEISDKGLYQKIKAFLEGQIAFSVYGGYLLFLIDNGIDPEKAKLKERVETSMLGTEWMMYYESSLMNKGLVMNIDPISSLFLEKGTQGRLNLLFLQFPELMKITCKEANALEKFLNWGAHQGYILGMLEEKIKTK